MNVEYRCKFEVRDYTGELLRRCGTRMFLPPGGKSPHKCRHHPDAGMEQIEQTTAPDFLFVDEGGHTKSQDTILPDADGNMTRRVKPEPTIDRTAPPNPVLVMELTTWRNAYVEEFDVTPDLRWGVARIQEEILQHRKEKELSQEVEGQTTDDSGNNPNTEGVEDGSGWNVDDDTGNTDDYEGDPELITTHRGQVVSEIPPAQEGDD